MRRCWSRIHVINVYLRMTNAATCFKAAMYTISLPARSIQARSRVNRWAVSWLWIDASMSRVPLSGAPHGSGKVRLGFTYRITTLSILHSAAVGPAHSLSGTIETDCPPARPLTSSAAVRAPLPHASAARSSSPSNLFDSPPHQLTAPYQ